METKYGNLPDEMLEVYFNRLIGMTFKILPLREENIQSLPTYLDSFLCEIFGLKELIYVLREDADFLRLLSTLQYIASCDETVDNATIKREVFKGINIIKALQHKYVKEC